MNDSIILRGQNISKIFHKGGVEIPVLRSADIEITRGEDISIVGQSGSGKSTLLHMLGALDRPSGGELHLADKDGHLRNVYQMPPNKIDAIRNNRIGFIFQFHHLLPDNDAVRNVAMPLIIGGQSKAEASEKATILLERVGLGHRLHHKPGELSGGEQQRVAIARAIIHQPDLILADEPTGNLDPQTAESILDLLLELRTEVNGALVVVTHDHNLARRCSRRLQLVDGVLETWE
jgi:lipoprotein-releasing system ATP-binding protein